MQNSPVSTSTNESASAPLSLYLRKGKRQEYDLSFKQKESLVLNKAFVVRETGLEPA